MRRQEALTLKRATTVYVNWRAKNSLPQTANRSENALASLAITTTSVTALRAFVSS